ncbi:hypothetical protein M3Y97_00357200 [Aphelenchoides bicaudatus]|nr:hypothetical protein M3Y97_00357200 [Aphelenchoides bicaudatus]
MNLLAMTNGDLFSKRTAATREFRQGNTQKSLHPLNERYNVPHYLNNVIDDKLDLMSAAGDYNSVFGPNALSLAEPLQNNFTFFPNQTQAEAKTKPQILFDKYAKARLFRLATQNLDENPSTKTDFEIMKQRRKKRESKQKFNTIESKDIEGHIGGASVEEILVFLDPDRAKSEALEKKKKKKSSGVRKNKSSKSDTKDMDVEVELDIDDAPDEHVLSDVNEEPMEGIEEEEENSNVDAVGESTMNEVNGVISNDAQFSSERKSSRESIEKSNDVAVEKPVNVETTDQTPAKVVDQTPAKVVEEPTITFKANPPTTSIAKNVKKEKDLSKDANREALCRGWKDFMQKYEGSIHTFVDTLSKRHRDNAQKRRSDDDSQKEGKKTTVYRNSQKPRN